MGYKFQQIQLHQQRNSCGWVRDDHKQEQDGRREQGQGVHSQLRGQGDEWEHDALWEQAHHKWELEMDAL